MSESESDNSVEKVQEKRLFVGGLFPQVTDYELKSRFGRFGTVKGVEIKIRKDSNGNPMKTFAYIDLETNERDFKKCVSTYNKTRWKGSELKIQVAKEDFMKKLKKEREEALKDLTVKEIPDALVSGIQSKLMAISDIATAANFNMRGAVPGTVIPGEEKWVVGKYGRVLPIVHMKKTGASKILKIDPSKLSHNLKRIKDDKYVDNVNPNQLTWQLEEYDNEISKKRKGEFPEWTPKVKRNRNINGVSSKDDLQQKVLEVVESDKTYRNSEFEVVPVQSNTGRGPMSDKAKHGYNDVGNIDSDSEENGIDMVGSSTNNIVDGYIDLSRFNSDSEEELSKDSFRKSGLGQFNQAQNKSLEKMQEQNIGITNKPQTNIKGVQSSKVILESNPMIKKNNKTVQSQNVADEYSNGLKDLKSCRDDFVDSDNESDGYESDCESDYGDNDDDDDLSNQQNTSNVVIKNQNIKDNSNLKPKIVEGKKTLLAFRGTKFLTSDSTTKTDLKGPQSNNVPIKVKETTADNVVCPINKESNSESKRKAQLKMKKQTIEINFEKSNLKRAGFKNFVDPKFLSNEFASGLDMGENSNVGHSSEEEDDDSDFERYAKKEMAKIESRKVQVETSNLEQLKQDKKEVDYFKSSKSEEIKTGYHSSSSSDDSDNETKTDLVSLNEKTNTIVMNTEDQMEEGCVSKPVASVSLGRENEIDDEDDDDDIHIVDDDNDAGDSSSDFETLISKAVKEAHVVNVKHSDTTLDDLPKASKFFNESNKCESSTESESSEESSGADTDEDKEINDNVNKGLEHSNNVLDVLKSNHNRNLDINSQFHDLGSDDDTSSNVSINSNEDIGESPVNKNKHISDGKKNQTLDYSGIIMSESSDSDNDTLVETETDSSDDESSLCNDNTSITAVDKVDTVVQSVSEINEANVQVGVKNDDENEESDSVSDSEEDDSTEAESSSDIIMTKGGSEIPIKSDSVKTDLKQAERTKSYSKDPIKTKDSCPQNVGVNDKRNKNVSSPVKRTLNSQDSSVDACTFQKNVKTSFDGPSPVKKVFTQDIKTKVKVPQQDNKADTDKKRLAAVKQRQKEALALKSLIKNALSNIDASKTVNTKIKFDSDSEEEQVSMETDEPIPVCKFQNQNKNVPAETKILAKSKTLFDSDDNSDGDASDNDANRFNIREEFEGAEGRKLAKLQARFGHDERFRLDARFIESASEDEEEEKIEEEDETTRSLKILQSVVGVKAVSGVNKQDKAKKKFKDIGALMYDPTCEEHKQFEVETKQVELPQPVERKKKKKGKKEVTALETEPAVILPEVTKEKFYEISDTLKNTFVEKAKATTDAPSSGAGFSLLAAFGTHYSDDDSDDDANIAKGAQGSAIPIPDVLRTNQLSLANRFNVRDDAHREDSDGDDDEKEIAGKELEKNVDKMDTTEPTSKQALDITKPKNFFFLPNDERLKESVTQKKNSSNQGDWFSKRRHLIESYKSKHKNLRRKKGPMKKRGGKR